MNKYWPLILSWILLLFCVWHLGNKIQKYTNEVNLLRTTVLYDIEHVRNVLDTEMQSMWMQGCHFGTGHPEGYKKINARHEFNQHSVPIYCGDELKKEVQSYIDRKVLEVGEHG